MILRHVNCVEAYNKRVQCVQSMQQAWVTQEMNLTLWTTCEISVCGGWYWNMSEENSIEMAQDGF